MKKGAILVNMMGKKNCLGDIKGYTLADLKTLLVRHALPAYSAVQVFSWVYKKRVEDFGLMSDLSKKSRAFLQESFDLSGFSETAEYRSKDGTRKFLYTLADGSAIETVAIPEKKRHTLCVSSQVGCRFRCIFCVSGAGGFVRNLSADEIVNQYLYTADVLYPAKITNVVFMGIGEPLDNAASVIKAIAILRSSKGIALGKRKFCVSTAGVVPGIYRLLTDAAGTKLSISLHAADDALRTKLMPINRKYPLRDVIRAARAYARRSGYPVTFEYALIKGLNDGVPDAQRLARLVKGATCKVNIIPYNTSEHSSCKPPSADEVRRFTDTLEKYKIFYIIRRPRGADISAACGQLKARCKKT